MIDTSNRLPGICIEDVRDWFEQWRKTRTKGSRIPEELWEAAVGLAPKHSVSGISKALGLDFKVLKERVNLKGGKDSLGFIELDVRRILQGGGCIVEMEHRDGSMMRMRFEQVSGSDLREIAEVFWSRA